MSYRYVASTRDGRLVKGVSDLASRDAVVQELGMGGLVVVSVDPVRVTGKIGHFGLHALGFVSHLDKVIFTKHLTVMVKAGLSLLESLKILEDQTVSGRFRAIIGQVVRSVEKGNSLSDSLAVFPKVFSPFYTNIVRAGETAGTLEENLDHLAAQFTKDHELRGRVRNALTYPIFVVVAGLAIGFYFALYIIPQITGLFVGLKGIELPLPTRVMLGIANFTRDHSLPMIVGLLGTVVFLSWFLSRKFMRPLVHGAIIRLPIFGKLARDLNLARFCLVLGTQMRSGIPIMQALEVTARVLDNWHYKQAIATAAEAVRRGNALSDSLGLHPDVFPRLTIRMIEVGERSGRMEEIFGFLSDFYSLEVETTMKNMTTILEPVLLVTIGLMAMGLAYAIIIPIYNFISAIGNMGR